MLALEIINYNKNLPENNKIKLKGILVGNGVTDWEYDSSGYTMIDFLFTHHLISYESKLDINRYCLSLLKYKFFLCSSSKVYFIKV